MTFNDGKLTMTGIDPKTIFFSDRPNRIAGHTPISQFVKEWAVGDDNFADNNPNATLAVFGPDQEEPIDAVVVLSNTTLTDGNLSYEVGILEGSLPESGGECTLFIDIIGRPMTPGSMAGVARRTTAPAPTSAAAKTPEQRLNDLQSLLDKGLITESEYNEKRKAILDKL